MIEQANKVDNNRVVAATSTPADNGRTQLRANIDACIPGTWAHAEAETELMSDFIFESTAMRLQALPFLGQALSTIYAPVLGVTGFASMAVGIATLPAAIFSTTMKQFSLRAINVGSTLVAYAIVCAINAETFGAIALILEFFRLRIKQSEPQQQQPASTPIAEATVWHNNPLWDATKATAQ